MKKGEVAKIVLAILFSIALFVGSILLLWYFGYDYALIVLFPVGFVSAVILHEMGHLKFGLFNKMKLVCVKILGIKFYGKKFWSKYKTGAIAYVAVTPKSNKTFKKDYAWFLGGGILFSVGMALVCYCVLYYLMDYMNSYLTGYVFFTGAFSLLIAIYNFIPVNDKAMQKDGTKLFAIWRGDARIEYLAKVFACQNVLINGGRYEKIPKDYLFNIPVVADNTIERILLENFRLNYYVDTQDLENIKKSAEFLNEFVYELDDVYFYDCVSNLIVVYTHILNDTDKARRLREDLDDNPIENKVLELACKIALEIYLDDDFIEAQKLFDTLPSMRGKYPIKIEEEFYENHINNMMIYVKGEKE